MAQGEELLMSLRTIRESPMTRTFSSRREGAVGRWVLTPTGLLPFVLITAWLIGDAVQPASYSPIRQTVSVLAGYAGTDRWIVTGALYLEGICYLLAAAGLTAIGRSARIGL